MSEDKIQQSRRWQICPKQAPEKTCWSPARLAPGRRAGLGTPLAKGWVVVASERGCVPPADGNAAWQQQPPCHCQAMPAPSAAKLYPERAGIQLLGSPGKVAQTKKPTRMRVYLYTVSDDRCEKCGSPSEMHGLQVSHIHPQKKTKQKSTSFPILPEAAQAPPQAPAGKTTPHAFPPHGYVSTEMLHMLGENTLCFPISVLQTLHKFCHQLLPTPRN